MSAKEVRAVRLDPERLTDLKLKATRERTTVSALVQEAIDMMLLLDPQDLDENLALLIQQGNRLRTEVRDLKRVLGHPAVRSAVELVRECEGLEDQARIAWAQKDEANRRWLAAMNGEKVELIDA